jgi:hypothetical protein
MDREVVLLQQLRRGLTGWLPVIRRATAAKEVHVELDKSKGLSIVATWVDRQGEEHKHAKLFGMETLFGSSLLFSPAGRQLVKKPCDCAREYIRELLTERGVLT